MADALAVSNVETRIETIVAQINYIVRETTGSIHFQDVLRKGMLENQWISEVQVLAIDEKDKIWAEIKIEIDWERYKINLNRHGETIAVDKNLPVGEQVSWVIGEIVKWFKNYTIRTKFRTEWYIRYNYDIVANKNERARINALLGMETTKAKTWVSANIEDVLVERPESLDEITTRLRVANNL